MKRVREEEWVSYEFKKQPKETRCWAPILSLCIATAKALVPVNKPTAWSRAIHIPASPIADPSLLVQIHAVLMRRIDFEYNKNRPPVLRKLASEFPLTRHRRVIAAIHCCWRVQCVLNFPDWPVATRPGTVLYAEFSKWLSPGEFDLLLIHANITNPFSHEPQELLLQTPSVFARHLETMSSPVPFFSFEVRYLIQHARHYILEYPELVESVMYPNIRAIFNKLATLSPERLHFDLAWIFDTVQSLPLIKAVWPLINLRECPSPLPIFWLKHAPPEPLNWVIANMPRAAKLQLLGQQRALILIDQSVDPAILEDLRKLTGPSDWQH